MAPAIAIRYRPFFIVDSICGKPDQKFIELLLRQPVILWVTGIYSFVLGLLHLGATLHLNLDLKLVTQTLSKFFDTVILNTTSFDGLHLLLNLLFLELISMVVDLVVFWRDKAFKNCFLEWGHCWIKWILINILEFYCS